VVKLKKTMNDSIKSLFVFVFLDFSIACFADIVLNDLSTTFGYIPSLQTYFHNQSILTCAVAAGITVVAALLPTMVLSRRLFGFFVPRTASELVPFSSLAFCIGYLADVFIERQRVFGSRLDAYYRSIGAGTWGAIAFVFSIVVTFVVQTIVLPCLV